MGLKSSHVFALLQNMLLILASQRLVVFYAWQTTSSTHKSEAKTAGNEWSERFASMASIGFEHEPEERQDMQAYTIYVSVQKRTYT